MIDLSSEINNLLKMSENVHKIFPKYITHIRFPRYKNMAPNTRLDFEFPITALVGQNGSGKTSVLNALYGAPIRKSTGEYWFSTEVDPIEEGEGSPNRFIYGHYNIAHKSIVETRKARVQKRRDGKEDPNYWEPTKESPGDSMAVPNIAKGKKIEGRSLDRWNPVNRKVVYINFRRELSAFDKYFYFGKDPVEKGQLKRVGAKTINSKKELIRRDSARLAKVLELEDTSLILNNRKVATENRILSPKELSAVSFILGREYKEARLVKHRLFKGDGNLSIRFITNHGQYSEAFAGSGEVAVTSCVAQALEAKPGSLLLLDEPEVSLHPGAQERLLAFIAKTAKENKLQVVFSTHSPHLIAALPHNAIKTFVQLQDGSFSILPSTHPYAAFQRLGVLDSKEIIVIVEDRLAQTTVQQSLLFLEDEALRNIFRIEYLPGGSSAVLKYRIPVLMEGDASPNVLVLLDGDQKKGPFVNPEDIPDAINQELGRIIKEIVDTEPQFLVDGGNAGGNEIQLTNARRRYLKWIGSNLNYLPLSCPEEIALKATNKLDKVAAGNSLKCKAQLQKLASENKGTSATSEEIDSFGSVLLGMGRNESQELKDIADILHNFASNVKRA